MHPPTTTALRCLGADANGILSCVPCMVILRNCWAIAKSNQRRYSTKKKDGNRRPLLNYIAIAGGLYLKPKFWDTNFKLIANCGQPLSPPLWRCSRAVCGFSTLGFVALPFSKPTQDHVSGRESSTEVITSRIWRVAHCSLLIAHRFLPCKFPECRKRRKSADYFCNGVGDRNWGIRQRREMNIGS